MKLTPKQGWLAAAILVTSLWSGTPAFAYSIGDEIKIDMSQPEISKAGFDISKDYAVWMVEGDKTITLYDLDDNSEVKIGSKSSTKTSPRVDGDYVVWIDSRDGGSDVYLYDISKKKESRLTSGSAKVSHVEIEGESVVWDDKSQGGSDIFLYDISSGDVEQISTSGKASNPTAGNTYIAWQDERSGNADIYYYNLDTKSEKAAVTSRGNQVNASIYGDQIIYEDQSGEYSQLGLYTVSKDRSKTLTDNSGDKQFPHIYKNAYVFIDDGSAAYGDVNKSGSKDAASFVYDKLPPRIYGDYLLYAKNDSDKKLRLNLYDIDEREALPIGAVAGDPSQPDGHDRYVVFISEGTNSDSVILYDVENGTSRALTDADADPSRPLVSNHYVVWYDNSKDALFSYDLKKGVTKQVTDEDDDQAPDDSMYELDGDNLLWVNVDSRSELIVTDLSSGKDTEIVTLKKDPLSIDLYGNYVSWVLEQSSNKASVFLYDIEEEDEMEIRKSVQVTQATLGDNFVVWSEYTDTTKPSWDLYTYDIDRGKTTALLRYSDRDQMNPQASRNMVFFEDNRLSPNKKDFYYELYDVEDGTYSDYYWDDEAEVEDARIGGNRLVWIDKREDTPYVYTLAFAAPNDDDDDDNEPTPDPEPEPEPGDYKEYNFMNLVADKTLSKVMLDAGFENFYYVFFADTEKEAKISISDIFEDSSQLIKYFNQVDLEDVVVRVYK